MQIVCATSEAAASVLSLLLITGLHPVSDYAIEPSFSSTPPITFIMRVSLTASQVGKIRAIPDTTIFD
jgi:hypothetical protein